MSRVDAALAIVASGLLSFALVVSVWAAVARGSDLALVFASTLAGGCGWLWCHVYEASPTPPPVA